MGMNSVDDCDDVRPVFDLLKNATIQNGWEKSPTAVDLPRPPAWVQRRFNTSL